MNVYRHAWLAALVIATPGSAYNAGAAMAGSGTWPAPVRAPELQAACDGQTVTLDDLRGRFVLLVIGPDASAANPDVVTIVTEPSAAMPAGVCTADDETVPLAYAVVSGIPAGQLSGTRFLIDDRGWLRALNGPGAPESWADRRVLAAEIGALRAHPVGRRPHEHADVDRCDRPSRAALPASAAAIGQLWPRWLASSPPSSCWQAATSG